MRSRLKISLRRESTHGNFDTSPRAPMRPCVRASTGTHQYFPLATQDVKDGFLFERAATARRAHRIAVFVRDTLVRLKGAAEVGGAEWDSGVVKAYDGAD